jgi:LmbE family N-acetylglucosaminyl deacetylase
LVKYASEGVDTYLLMATRGERGRFGTQKESPGLDIVGKTREQELLAAADILKIKEVTFLDYIDGELDKAVPTEVIDKISTHIRRVQPQVVVSFGPEGAYGHPDHIAVSQFATAAIVRAADPSFVYTENYAPFAVSKLYYIAWPPSKWEAYQAALKQLSVTVDGYQRIATPYPDWTITTRIDTSAYWKTVWQAILCHQTQMGIYEKLASLTDEQHIALWGAQEFYRAFSLVNGGRQVEIDLFEGFSSRQ